ncbi:uroporphyrinogen-III synthase [Nitrosovibrio sp. Nv17]|uniref:uroporphyrinogen-III synthase n=1 Tax=Nitrosovibrio sp. Nv17 TaxID=1855339 RepID=UPI000908EC57|nr:uroporphyrinogen-III synthase [Nitrosovibrio sp. Nv17]SFW28043.1 uroporphyrinogen-III synthase [Nitrosovibrio sp. Nv17]
MNGALAGIGILVTRPVRQAEDLAAAIRSVGGKPFLLPVLEILAVEDTPLLSSLIGRVEEFDIAIFVSPNAVAGARRLMGKKWPPSRPGFVAVGQGTARALREAGIHDPVVPAAGFDSEALLDLPLLQAVRGRRVIVFRGNGGRELLGTALRARGALLEYAECYRRARPASDANSPLHGSAREEIGAIVVTSSEGLRNLCDMAGSDKAWLMRIPLFVPHARIVHTARQLGFERIVPTSMGDAGLLQGLLDHFKPKAG